jgi:hypothetical protein
MATTEVRVQVSGDYLVPDISTLPFSTGDVVTFIAPEDSDVHLCMNGVTASILSISADASAEIPAGGSVSFQFASSTPGTYLVLTQWPDAPCPAEIANQAGTDAVLSIQPAPAASYSGPGADTQT